MNKLAVAARAAVVTLLALFVLSYFGMSFFYMDHFVCGMYINNLYVTGMTVSQASRALLEEGPAEYVLTVTESGNSTETISGSSINAVYDYTEGTEKALAGYNPFMWVFYAGMSDYVNIEPDVAYDTDLAVERIKQLDIYKAIPEKADPEVSIKKNGDGTYYLYDTTAGAKDPEKLVKLILAAMRDDKTDLDICSGDYDFDYTCSDEMLATKALFGKIDEYQNTDVRFSDSMNEIKLTKSDIAGLIEKNPSGTFVTDVNGCPELDRDAAAKIAEKLSEVFTTAGKNIIWKKYTGGTVSINSGEYGQTVDTEKETDCIIKAVESGGFYGAPEYTASGNKALSDIGDTYIEVDMTAQHLYYIKDGKLFMDSDVVTGNVSRRGRATPQMLVYIYQMQKDRVLVGENYRTPVKYWMAIHNHIGLHDADWRSTFGGEIYKKNGSHGCINLPPDFAEKLYGNVQVGLPVICYY